MNTEDTSPRTPAGSSAPTEASQPPTGSPHPTSAPYPGGTGPTTPGGPTVPSSGTDRFFDTVRRMGISRSDERWIGGVAGGIADRFGIDPLIVRGILVVSVFLSGAGLVLYGVAWALLPEARDNRIHLQQAIRGDFDIAMLGAAATTVVGLSWSNGWLSWWHFAGLDWLNGLLWTAAVITVIVLVVNRRKEYRRSAPTGQAPRPAPYPGAPVPPYQANQPFGVPPVQQGQHPQYGAPVPGAQPAPGVTYPVSPAAPSGPAFNASAPLPPQGYPGQRPLPSQVHAAQHAAAAQQAARAHDHAQRQAQRETDRLRRVEEQAARASRKPRGPGSAVVGITLGASLLGAAVLMLLERRDVIDVPFFYTWIGATIVLLGLGIVISGLRGRTSGALGGLAIAATVVALPVLGVTSFDRWDPEFTAHVSDSTYVVTSVQEAENGLSFTFGDPVVDLSTLDLSAVGDTPVVVPVSLRAGDLTVILPAGTPTEAEVRVVAGNATWTVDGERRTINGVNTRPHTFVTSSVADGADPVLLLEVDVAAGDVTIREES